MTIPRRTVARRMLAAFLRAHPQYAARAVRAVVCGVAGIVFVVRGGRGR